MAKTKKVEEEVSEPVVVTEPVPPALAQQQFLLELRATMVAHGIDSISKLDALLSQANQEVNKLNL